MVVWVLKDYYAVYGVFRTEAKAKAFAEAEGIDIEGKAYITEEELDPEPTIPWPTK